MSVDKLGETLGRGLAKQEDMKRELTERDGVNTWFLLPITQLKTRAIYYDTQTQPIAGDNLIWGHPTNGIWGTHYWNDFVGGTATNMDFTLTSATKGLLGTNILGTGNIRSIGTANPFTSHESGDILDKLTIAGRNEIRDFLSNTSTARPPYYFQYSDGTTAYQILATALPDTTFGSAIIGTATRDDTGLTLQGDTLSVNAGTGDINSFGLISNDGTVMFHYKVLTDSLSVDNTNNYRFISKINFQDDSGEFNTWTNVGTAYIADWFGGTSEVSPTHIGFGTGTTAASPVHTTLEGEFIRNAIDSYTKSIDLTSDLTAMLLATEGVGTTITRSGIWTGGTADGSAEMIIENKHFDIPKTALFQIDLQHRNRKV